MKYLIPFVLFTFIFLGTSSFASGQSTTVSGTIADTPDGQAWFGGTFSFVFRVSPSNPTAQYFFNGAPFSSSQTIAGALDGSGHYSQGVPPNTSITPAGSTWDATFCPLATAQCVTYQSVTITGATQTLSPSPPSIRINLAVPLQNPRAYTDTEIVNGALGQTYFNLVSTFIRVCSVFPCGWTNSGSGGSSITLKTNGTTNPVQSLLNIIGGTAITATADGSGGVTVASTIGPPCNSLGVFQAGNGTGGYNCTNVSESGGVLTNTDTNSNRGPNPAVDITAPPFNARVVSTSSIPTTTGTIAGGTNSLTVASNSGWQKNDGLALVGGGATNCTITPNAPTVTPSLASTMTGTGHAVAGATGSTSYSYVVIAVSQGGCYTAASAIGTTSTGNAALGATNIPITSCSNLAGTVTCTVGTTANLATGMWTRMGGTSDDQEFGGRHNITVLNGTQFTYASNESSIYPMISTTATGGTLYFWVENHIALPPLPTGTNLFQFGVYRCIGASCALPANAGNYSLVYMSYPANLGYIDSGYNTWDDYGTISTVTIGQSAPWFIPSTPPATNVNDMLVTTVTNISGATFTLSANATNTTSSAPMRFDNAPAIALAESTSNSSGSGGGGAIHLPAPPLSGISGPSCYVTSSYLVLSSITNEGNYLCPGHTLELSGSRSALLGAYENTISSIFPSFGIQTLPELLCLGANPCIWRKGPQIKNLYITSLGPSQTLVFDSTLNAATLTENVHLNVPDGMGINYYSYGQGFGGMFRNISLTSGPTQVIGSIDTPSFIDKDNNELNFDYVSGSLRGIFFECTNNPPNSCGNFLSLKMGEEWQGPITPILTVNSLSGGRFGFIYMEHIIQDSGSEPIFVNGGGANLSSIVINGTNGPGKDPSSPNGDNQPIISGNQIFGGVSLNIGSGAISQTSATGMNHDITMCSGQAGSNQTGYAGCTLPSLNLATASYAVSHTLNASEGVVNETGSGTTITANSALSGQVWDVFNRSAGTVSLAISSGTLFCNGAIGTCTIPINQGVHVACDGINCSALGLGGGGGGGSPGGATGAIQSNGGGGAFQGTNSPTNNGIYNVIYNVTAGVGVNPTIALPGIPVNQQTGTTYTIGAANTFNDRGTQIRGSNVAAQTYTAVNPSATGFGFNMFYSIWNIGTASITENSSGFNINSGTSLLIPPNWVAPHTSDGVNYFSPRFPSFEAFPLCVDSGGNHLNMTTTGLTCGTSASGNGLSGMTAGQVPIAASATSVTSSEALAGAGAAIVTGPSTSVNTDLVTYTGTAGQTADSGVLLANVWRKDVANVSANVNHDFSAGTWKWPAGAGATATATNNSALDTTNKNEHCYMNNADAICLGIPTAPATGDLFDSLVSSGNVLAHDSGIATANVVTAPSPATAAKQTCVSSGASKTCTYIDHSERYFVPSANCNNTTAGAGWSIGSGGTVTCRGGTNNKGGYVAITDTSTTFAQFTVTVPEDWDTATNPFIRFYFGYPGTDTGHTIIPAIQVSCSKGDGTTTDDVTFNASHSSSTTTTNATANQFWSNSNVQMNATDVTGCVAGAQMTIQVGRATDTATSAVNFYGVDVTFPRLLTVGAE